MLGPKRLHVQLLSVHAWRTCSCEHYDWLYDDIERTQHDYRCKYSMNGCKFCVALLGLCFWFELHSFSGVPDSYSAKVI